MNLRVLALLGMAGGLLVLTGCPVDPVGSGGSGGTGGNEASSSSTGGTGGTGGSAGSATGGGGSGGGATCDHCADYVTALAFGMVPKPICPAPEKSEELLKALNTCTCDMAAGCGTDCGPSQFCTMGGPAATAACTMCVQTGKCMASFGACAGDSNP
jgi:hypothetical protein